MAPNYEDIPIDEEVADHDENTPRNTHYWPAYSWTSLNVHHGIDYNIQHFLMTLRGGTLMDDRRKQFHRMTKKRTNEKKKFSIFEFNFAISCSLSGILLGKNGRFRFGCNLFLWSHYRAFLPDYCRVFVEEAKIDCNLDVMFVNTI